MPVDFLQQHEDPLHSGKRLLKTVRGTLLAESGARRRDTSSVLRCVKRTPWLMLQTADGLERHYNKLLDFISPARNALPAVAPYRRVRKSSLLDPSSVNLSCVTDVAAVEGARTNGSCAAALDFGGCKTSSFPREHDFSGKIDRELRHQNMGSDVNHLLISAGVFAPTWRGNTPASLNPFRYASLRTQLHLAFFVSAGIVTFSPSIYYELATTIIMLANVFLRVLQVALLCLLPPALKVAYDLYIKLRKPCDLPVMNLSGWRFEEAKQKYISNLWDYLKLGREESPNQAIQLYGPEGYVVVVPERFVEEMKALDDSVSDNLPLFTDILSDFLFFDISKGHIMRKVVSSKLNVKLADLLPEIMDETTYAMNLKLPPTDDWTAVNINKELSQIVSLVSGRIFVGSPLNRNDGWVETNITFSEDIYAAGVVLKKRSYFHKLITVWFSTCPELQRMDKCKAIARRLFIPMIKQREALLEKDPNHPLPNDAITWVMSLSATDYPRPTYEQQAELQLMLSMASIHTSRTTLTNALYDLLSRPEYLAPLRAEVDAQWNPTVGIDKTTPSQLVLLDSFLKESQRLTPVGQLTFDRRITSRRGFTLSNGLHLRHGTHVAVAAHQVSLDASIWGADASSFNGFRFSDLRKKSAQNANKFQFASTDSTSALNFGFGNHDCPGRHFASTEIKCILAYLLRNYDLKAPEDWKGKRPETIFWAQRMSPDSKRCVMMRRRRWKI